MGAAFWIKRYLLAAVPLFGILVAAEYVRGTPTRADFLSAGLWAAVAAAIFIGAAYRRYRAAQAQAPVQAPATPPAQNRAPSATGKRKKR